MTWSCNRCGRPFLTEEERDKHQGQCGYVYKLPKCIYCNGSGKTYYGAKCPHCNGSGVKRP